MRATNPERVRGVTMEGKQLEVSWGDIRNLVGPVVIGHQFFIGVASPGFPVDKDEVPDGELELGGNFSVVVPFVAVTRDDGRLLDPLAAETKPGEVSIREEFWIHWIVEVGVDGTQLGQVEIHVWGQDWRSSEDKRERRSLQCLAF